VGLLDPHLALLQGDTQSRKKKKKKKKKKLSACRGEGSVVGLQLHVRVVLAALLAICEGLHWLTSVFLKLEI
jgi:hypothetical protein